MTLSTTLSTAISPAIAPVWLQSGGSLSAASVFSPAALALIAAAIVLPIAAAHLVWSLWVPPIDRAFAVLCLRLRLCRAERQALRQLAAMAGATHPVALLLSPSALANVLARAGDFGVPGPVLARLRRLL